MADVSKLVNELSNLTVMESAELANMLKEKWGTIEVSQSGEVRAAQKPTEGADIKLIRTMRFIVRRPAPCSASRWARSMQRPRKPERASRDRTSICAGKPARYRRRTGHGDMGRRRSIRLAEKLYAAGRQPGVARAGARSCPRSFAAARHDLPSRRGRPVCATGI